MPNDNNKQPHLVHTHDVQLDADYTQWLVELKARYRSAQIKAAVRVNAEKLLFNWQLGRDLVIKKAESRWGEGIVEQLSLDLKAEFPYIFAFIPWRHHVEIVIGCKTIDESLYYVRNTTTCPLSHLHENNTLSANSKTSPSSQSLPASSTSMSMQSTRPCHLQWHQGVRCPSVRRAPSQSCAPARTRTSPLPQAHPQSHRRHQRLAIPRITKYKIQGSDVPVPLTLEASTFVEVIEKRQGLKIACLEGIAYRNGWITEEKMRELAKPMIKNQYGQYLLRVIEEKKEAVDSDTFRG